MKEKTFGETLRSLREREKLSVKEVIEQLKKYGLDITDKTLYSYESDKRAASADMLLALCQIYNCNNVLETFAGFDPDYSIPDDSEWELIEKYRSLDSSGKNTVDAVIQQEIERSKEVLELLKCIENQEIKIVNQQDRINLLEQRIVTELVHRIAVPLYDKFASAGSGAYLFDDIPTDMIEVEDTPTARKADFVIGVNGDSMKPDFYDGEKVFVKKASDLNVGDIGIFLKGEDCYIKELGTDRLISHNPDKDRYPDIQADEDVRLIGKVIGKVEED